MGGYRSRGELSPDRLKAERAADLRRKYLAATGRPSTVTGAPVAAVCRKVRVFRARGMTTLQMADQTGMNRTSFRDYSAGVKVIKRKFFERLVALEFEEPIDTAIIDATGTSRRLQSLWYDGFPVPWIVEHAGIGTRSSIREIMSGETPRVTARTARAVSGLYDKLAESEPGEFGIGDRKVRFCRTFAGKQGYVPRYCWDPDTIDDPAAIPQWTGRCGTELGHYIHRRDGIPMCEPCSRMGSAAGVDRRLMDRFDPKEFRARRERFGYSRRALAAAASATVSVNPGTIQYWEEGRNRPQRQGKLEACLGLLDATLEDVLIEEGEGS